MLKLKLLSIALLATLSTSTMAFSIDSIGKKALGNAAQACMLAGKAIDANGLESQQKNLQAGSKKISQEILAAQTKLAEALDLKQVAANLDAQVKTLKKGNINGDKLDKVTSVSEDANEAIEVQMKKMDSLTAEQKKKVSESLGQYGTAAWDTAKLTGRVVAAGTAMGCVVAQNPMNAINLKGQLGYIADAASTLPGFSKDLITTGFSYVKLAKDFGVDTSAAEKKLKQAASIKFEK